MDHGNNNELKEISSNFNNICFNTITATTDDYGQIHVDSYIISRAFAFFVEGEKENLTFALKSGQNELMVFAITNTSLTNETIKHVANAKVTVRIIYLK